MDMGIVILDQKNRELQYAGANSPLYLVRKKTKEGEPESELNLSAESGKHVLYKISGDKQPIGVHWEESDFTDHVISLKDEDALYLVTDGFVDQYGGRKRRKFKSKRLRKLLLSFQEKPMEVQKQLLEETFEQWRGSHEQIDDVCALGVRI